jgi:hypothetical protein
MVVRICRVEFKHALHDYFHVLHCPEKSDSIRKPQHPSVTNLPIPGPVKTQIQRRRRMRQTAHADPLHSRLRNQTHCLQIHSNRRLQLRPCTQFPAACRGWFVSVFLPSIPAEPRSPAVRPEIGTAVPVQE